MPGLAAVLALAAVAAPVRVTYLANEGVLIGGPCAVLVDALFRDSLGAYPRHAAGVREALEEARPPFDSVGLALATHYHLDHWDPGAIARFLGSNPRALYAAPPEAVAMMPAEVRAQVRPLSRASPTLEAGGARVDVLALAHGAPPGAAPAPHNGYRIACGTTVLAHLGDSSPDEASFATLAAAGPVDVAFVPFWWLLGSSGRTFVLERWKPRHVVVVHLGGGDGESAAEIARSVPRAWVCTRPGESRTF
jgi:L-ascorbate metabolism protein UlaG (beta-lactamase superfamily)